jgi:hypothetical protein
MSRLPISFALITGLLITGVAPQLASAQPNAERRMAPPPAGDHPTEEPPAPPEEHYNPRRGYDWIAGSYDWHHGAWRWQPGHFAARKKWKRYQPGHWDHVGDHLEFVAGSYTDAPKEPEAPPPLREEREIRRTGFTWVKGYWEWNNGSYDWVVGHLSARPHGKRWTDGHWDNGGGKWAWTPGAFVAAPTDPDAPPPEIVVEKEETRPGSVWIKGYYKWNAGAYEWVAGHLEREHAGKHWVDGHWDNSGGTWAFSAGAWQ